MACPYSPLAFANEFIVKAGPSGVVHMKLQKLVYMCFGWWLVAHDEPAINEAPQVWQHGPVFRSLYSTLASHGHQPIRALQSKFFTVAPDRVDDNDHDVNQLVDWVWNKYKPFDQFYLSDLTHKPGSPWYVTAESYGFKVPFNTEIPIDVIKDHFRVIAADRGFYEA